MRHRVKLWNMLITLKIMHKHIERELGPLCLTKGWSCEEPSVAWKGDSRRGRHGAFLLCDLCTLATALNSKSYVPSVITGFCSSNS